MAARNWDRAVQQYRKTIEMDPSVALVHDNLGVALEQSGNLEDAVQAYVQARQASGLPNESLEELRKAYVNDGLRGFREKDLEFTLAQADRDNWEAMVIASLYAQLGQSDAAMVWLEKAYEVRSASMVWLTIYPYFENLVSDPRFQDLLGRVGLPH